LYEKDAKKHQKRHRVGVTDIQIVFTWKSSSPEIIIGTETHLDPTYSNAEILPYDIPSSTSIKYTGKTGKKSLTKTMGCTHYGKTRHKIRWVPRFRYRMWNQIDWN
jgi:hypothetical protein